MSDLTNWKRAVNKLADECMANMMEYYDPDENTEEEMRHWIDEEVDEAKQRVWERLEELVDEHFKQE